MSNHEDGFQTSVDLRGPVPVVRVSGELDMYSAPRLREVLVTLVNEGQADLVVDMADVSFMDSSGLGVLVGVLKRCRTAGGSLVLRHVTPTTGKVLAITGLDRVFSAPETIGA